jgi:hypothetical protein
MGWDRGSEWEWGRGWSVIQGRCLTAARLQANHGQHQPEREDKSGHSRSRQALHWVILPIVQPFTNSELFLTGNADHLGVLYQTNTSKSSFYYTIFDFWKNTLTHGSIYTLSGMLQTSARIDPGNSEGVLVNLDGQLIGFTAV